MKKIDVVNFQKPELSDAQSREILDQMKGSQHDIITQMRYFVDFFTEQRLKYLVGVPKIAEGLVKPESHKKIAAQMEAVLVSIRTQLAKMVSEIDQTLKDAK